MFNVWYMQTHAVSLRFMWRVISTVSCQLCNLSAYLYLCVSESVLVFKLTIFTFEFCTTFTTFLQCIFCWVTENGFGTSALKTPWYIVTAVIWVDTAHSTMWVCRFSACRIRLLRGTLSCSVLLAAKKSTFHLTAKKLHRSSSKLIAAELCWLGKDTHIEKSQHSNLNCNRMLRAKCWLSLFVL